VLKIKSFCGFEVLLAMRMVIKEKLQRSHRRRFLLDGMEASLEASLKFLLLIDIRR
jgi:hypothetical protein